jgi:hypothetical protein
LNSKNWKRRGNATRSKSNACETSMLTKNARPPIRISELKQLITTFSNYKSVPKNWLR